MTKNQKNLRVRVLFNASVVLAGLRSPNGGSGKLLQFINNHKIDGIISEVIFDEILKHCNKLGISKSKASNDVSKLFKNILDAPDKNIVTKYNAIVIDEGDGHVLASCEESKIKYLVTLDKKHLLVLKDKIKGLDILTPGELLTELL